MNILQLIFYNKYFTINFLQQIFCNKFSAKCCQMTAWGIMAVEAMVVIARNSSHIRVTRALRPIFLLDCRHLGGVRRCAAEKLSIVLPKSFLFNYTI